MNLLEPHFEIVVYWHDEARQYVAEVPDLPGCRAAGETRCDAVANAEYAIDLWLKNLELTGEPVPAAQGRLGFR